MSKNTVVDCSQRRFVIQNDLRDWEINQQGEPVKVTSEKYWINSGYSVDPADIPPQKIDKIEDIKKVPVPIEPVDIGGAD